MKNQFQSKQTQSVSVSRRWFIEQCGVGMGALALNHLLAGAGLAQSAQNPLAPKKPHFAPKAKNVIYLFMAGAPSHLELFDNKPAARQIRRHTAAGGFAERLSRGVHQSELDTAGAEVQVRQIRPVAARSFRNCLPHFAKIVDDIAIVKSMATDAFNHAPAPVDDEHGRDAYSGGPAWARGRCMGSAAKRRTCPPSSSSAPARKARAAAIPVGAADFCRPSIRACSSATSAIRCSICPIRAASMTKLQRDSLDTISKLEPICGWTTVGDPEIATRINSFEMAYRMQASAPELMDISKEPKHILEMYGAEPGKPSFANNCLLARRLVERGVRFVQLYHEAWDQHGNLVSDLTEELQGHRSGLRRAGQGSETARNARTTRWSSGAANSAARRWCKAATMGAIIIRMRSRCGWRAAA